MAVNVFSVVGNCYQDDLQNRNNSNIDGHLTAHGPIFKVNLQIHELQR